MQSEHSDVEMCRPVLERSDAFASTFFDASRPSKFDEIGSFRDG